MVITHPQDQNIHHYFGVAEVGVIPPHDLYHPIFNYQHRGKLVMPLCRSCVEEEMSKPLHKKSHCCPHTDDQRMLHGTWCTPEPQKAAELGYQIVHIQEVWYFPPKQRRKGLFANYVNT